MMAQTTYGMVNRHGETIYTTEQTSVAEEWTESGYRVKAEVQ